MESINSHLDGMVSRSRDDIAGRMLAAPARPARLGQVAMLHRTLVSRRQKSFRHGTVFGTVVVYAHPAIQVPV